MNDLVEVHEGKLMVSSKDLAGSFDKPHKAILEISRKLMRDLDSDSQTFGHENFIESTYKTDRGKTYGNVMMTRDGFTLLAMGLSGKKALDWKIKYLEAFNQMESYIKKDGDSLHEKINKVSREIDDIKIEGSSWGKTGASIRKRKREAIDEITHLIAHAQLQLEF